MPDVIDEGTEVKDSEQSPGDVTTALLAWESGAPEALGHTFFLVYDNLRSLARRHFAGERPGHILQPTALINEAYLRLEGLREVHWKCRKQFFAFASRVMRRVLVEAARKRRSSKRGGGAEHLSITVAADLAGGQTIDAETLIDLDRALTELESFAPHLARLVELRFFSSLTVEEAAEEIGIARATANRQWRTAKAWLSNALHPS